MVGPADEVPRSCKIVSNIFFTETTDLGGSRRQAGQQHCKQLLLAALCDTREGATFALKGV